MVEYSGSSTGWRARAWCRHGTEGPSFPFPNDISKLGATSSMCTWCCVQPWCCCASHGPIKLSEMASSLVVEMSRMMPLPLKPCQQHVRSLPATRKQRNPDPDTGGDKQTLNYQQDNGIGGHHCLLVNSIDLTTGFSKLAFSPLFYWKITDFIILKRGGMCPINFIQNSPLFASFSAKEAQSL